MGGAIIRPREASSRRIAIVGNQAFAMVNFRGSLICELVRRGNQVFALAPDYDTETRTAIEGMGAEPRQFYLSRLGTNPLEDLQTLVQLFRALRDCRPDIVLAYTVKPVLYGTIAAWLLGIRRSFALIEGVGQVFDATETSPRTKVVRSVVEQLYRFALGKSERVFFLNDTDLSDFVSGGLVASGKAAQVGAIGLNLSEWPLSVPVTKPISFTFVGRLHRQKGVREFVEAARVIRASNPETRCVILGGLDAGPDGIPEDEVRSWVSAGVVEWPGHVRVLPWLAATSVFVLPSYREGAPRSTQEAMAVGRAIITTDVPGCRDMVVDEVNGLLVPARDSAALAAAMLRFIDEPELAVAMGKESRKLAERHFDASNFNAHLLEMMRL